MAETRDLVIQTPVIADPTRTYAGHLQPVTVDGLPMGVYLDDDLDLYLVQMSQPDYLLSPVERLFEVVSNGRVITREPENCRWLKPTMIRRELPELGEDVTYTQVQPKHVTMVGDLLLKVGSYEIAQWTTGDGLPPTSGETLSFGSEIYQWDGVSLYFINVATGLTLSDSIENLVNAIRTNTHYSVTVWNNAGTLMVTGSIPTPLLCSQSTDPWTLGIVATADSQELALAGKMLNLFIDELDQITVTFPINLTPEQVVNQINATCAAVSPDYTDVAYLRKARSGDRETVRLALTTATPQYAPREPRNTRIRVTGSACPYLGFQENWLVAGDLPAAYNDYTDFILMMSKRDDAAKKLESFIPVAEDNRLLRRAMAEFDANVITSNKRLKLFFDGLAWGLDCAEREADEVLNALDVDRVKPNFLANMATNLGFDLEALGVTDADTRREIVRNLIRLYRIKGTEISYESFFRFLSYYAEITERGSDAALGYPLINILPDDTHIISYYADFLQKDEHDSFFDQFKWFYVNVDDTDERLTERQWWNLPLVSGLSTTLIDSVGNAVSPASLTTTYLAAWNLHGNYGLMDLLTPCTPSLVVGETVYVDAAKVGKVIRLVSAKSYLLHYEDGAALLPLAGKVSGTLGGGSLIPGVFDTLHPNSQLKLLVDGRYVWEVNFDRYQSVYLTSQRAVTAVELEQALQIAAAEQKMPVDIIRQGEAVEIRGKTYGPLGQLKVLRPNAALGFTYNQTSPAVVANPVASARIIAGSARVLTPLGTVLGSLPTETIFPLTINTRALYFYLQDAETPNSGTIVDDLMVANQQLRRVAKLSSLELLDDLVSFRLTTEDIRDRYRTPQIGELTDSQYRQMLTYVRYNYRNDPQYWEAAGRAAAGDHDNPTRFEDRIPWAPPDLKTYPNLGNSIFVRLDVIPFTAGTLTTEQAQYILFLAEFLRPIHVTLDIVFQAMDAEDHVVGLPYDPASLLMGAFPEDPEPLVGNNFGYYFDRFSAGPSMESRWFFDWLQYQPGTAWLFLPAGTLPGWVLPGVFISPTPWPNPTPPTAEVLSTSSNPSWDIVEIADDTWAWPATGSFTTDPPQPPVAYSRHFPISAVEGYRPTDARWQDTSHGPSSAYFYRPHGSNPRFEHPGAPLLSNPYAYSVINPAIATALIKAPYDTIHQINFTVGVPELDALDRTTLPRAYENGVPGGGTAEYVFYDGGTHHRSFYRVYDVDPGVGPGTRQWVQIFGNGVLLADVGLTGGYIYDFQEFSINLFPGPTLFGDVPPWSSGGLYPAVAPPNLPHQGIGGTSIVSPTWDPATPYDRVYLYSPPVIPQPALGDVSFNFAPNRLATWAYPKWWTRWTPVDVDLSGGLGVPYYNFPVVVEPAMNRPFLTLSNLLQFRPSWDLSSAGGLEDPYTLGVENGTVLADVLVGPTSPQAFLQVANFDFTPYKTNPRHDWIQGVVEMQDGTDPTTPHWWWGYCMWRVSPYPPSPFDPDQRNRVYVFDINGNQGWMPHPTKPSVAGVPTSSARFVRIWIANTLFGELADRLTIEGEALFGEGAAQPPLDVFHDMPDSLFCGLWPAQGAAANLLTPNGIGRADLPLNRTFGYTGGSASPYPPNYLGWVWDAGTGAWVWTGGGWQPIHDTDALLIIKAPISMNASFVNPGVPYAYNNATGIIQFAAPVNLANVTQGDFFVDNNGFSFTVWGVDDATNRLMIRPGYAGFISVIGNGNCYMTQLRILGPLPPLVPVQDILSHNYLGFALPWTHVWSNMLPIGMTPLEKCSAIPQPYYISNDRILNTFPPIIVPGPPSLVDWVAYGACFIGAP